MRSITAEIPTKFCSALDKLEFIVSLKLRAESAVYDYLVFNVANINIATIYRTQLISRVNHYHKK